MRSAVALAPATIANVAVGFDILGFALAAPHDAVTVTRCDDLPGEVTIDEITGTDELPPDADTNTAAVALRAMLDDLGLGYGFRLRLHKAIPLGSGLGGSAASAVGAVVAANALLDPPLPRERLIPWALRGEAAASGAAHADNVMPCMLGGLCAALPAESSGHPPRALSLPVPAGVHCVVVHPHLRINTRDARGTLRPTVSLRQHVDQSARLLGFVVGCYSGDQALLRACLRDEVIEPQRAGRIPGFAAAREAALSAGALGCSIAGSGPSLFAWVPAAHTLAVERALRDAFSGEGLQADAWSGEISTSGARVEVE